MVFTFDGTYDSTILKNVPCVVVGTQLGRNVEVSMGSWKGIVYTSESISPDELKAVNGLLHLMMGNAFSNLDQRKESISIKTADDVHELALGSIAKLRIHAIKNSNGEATKVVNAPSPIAFPEMSLAIADEHTYDDGTSSWSFPGRNGFFAEFDMKSAEE